MMCCRQIAGEFVQGSAIGTAGFAPIINWDHDFRMRIPKVHVRHWAGQWKILGSHFNEALIDIVFAQVGLPDIN